MTLLRPEFIWLLLLWLPLTVGWWRLQQRSHWNEVIEPQLLQTLLKDKATAGNSNRWLVPLFMLLLILALAGPALKNQQQTTASQGNLYVLLDNSLSMAATDISPDRITRAKRMILDWVNSRLFDQASVIVYSASAHTLVPLTRDAHTIDLQLQSLTPFIMPEFGNRADLAMAHLNEMSQKENGKIHLLWLTDDISDQHINAIKQQLPETITATLVMVGTEEGSPVPLPNGQGYLTQDSDMVIVKTDTGKLQKAAKELGFQIAPLGAQPNADYLTHLTVQKSQQGGTKDLGIWLVMLLALIWLMKVRHSLAITAALVVILLPAINPAHAANLWQNSEQQAYHALLNEQYDQTLALSQQAMTRGQALFAQGKFDQSAETFASLASADGYFNQGNALAQAGKLKEAIQAYSKALSFGSHDAAETNKKAIEDFLKNQQNESGQQQGDSEQDSSQNDANNSQNSEQNSSQQNESENKQPSDADQSSQSQSQQDQQQKSEQDKNAAQDSDEQNSPQDSAENDAGEQQPSTAEKSNEGLNPEDMRATQESEAILNQLQSAPGSLLQKKFQYQYQQNPTKANTSPW